MSSLKLLCLGPPRVELDLVPLEFESRKGLALLVYLAVTGESYSRDGLSTLLWPDFDQSRARSYLRHTLWGLKKTLGETCLDISREQVGLNPAAEIWLDVARFQKHLAAAADEHHPDTLAQLAQAVELYRGDFLSGFTLPDAPEFDEWQFFQTEELRHKLAKALERLVAGYSERQAYEQALPYARRWLALDPLHEPAQQRLMQLYDRAGQPAAALRQYEEYVVLLEKEFGLPPGEETTTLYEAIKARRMLGPFLRVEEQRAEQKLSGDDPLASPAKRSTAAERQKILDTVTQQQQAGHYPAAIGLLKTLLAQNPADEPVHRSLMQTYALAGQTHEALRQFQACLEALAVHSAHPDPETETLYRQIMSGEVVPGMPTPKPIRLPPAPIAVEVERSAPLVGRGEELQLLQTRIQQAKQGHGCTLLLAGETGVGKTRLAYEALQAAAMSHLTTLAGAAYEQEGPLPYQPFVEAFDRFLAEQHLPPEQHPITHYKPLGSSDPQQEHSALFRAATTFLTTLATHSPVVLLLDDLHAADEASLSLFHYLARQTRASPVILLATYRTNETIPLTSPFGRLLNALYREHLSEGLNLGRLSEQAGAQIVAHTLGASADQALIKAIFDIAEGNPFYTQEISRTLQKSDYLFQQEGQWRLRPGITLPVPAQLRDLLQERVQRLGPTVEAVLSAAAAIGREFRFLVLQPVTGLRDAELLDALDTALNCQLLEETGEAYRFHHSLIRHTLYEALSRTRRAWLHTRIAEAIETVYGTRSEGLQPYVEVLAFHYKLSDQCERALPYLLQAGQKAVGIYALEVAIDYFEQALALLDKLGLADPGQRWQILEQLGWCAYILSDTIQAVACFEQAVALVPTANWQPKPGARMHLHLLAVLALTTAGNIPAADQHLAAALAEVGDAERDSSGYAYLLYNVAMRHWHFNEYEEAYQVAQRSLEIARWVDDAEAMARAYEMLALAAHSLGDWQQGQQFEKQWSAIIGPNLDVTIAFDAHL